jgi:hypothetical protein
MFYAASEIVFWILLAAIVGGGIGYGLSQAKALRINKRLTQSRADAPMERELAIAWETIEDLNRRLQVAHETIRDSGAGDDSPDDDLVEVAPVADTDNIKAAPADASVEATETAEAPIDDAKDTVIDMSAARPATPEATNGLTAKKPAAKKPATSKTKTGTKTKAVGSKATAAKSSSAESTASKPPAKTPAAQKAKPSSDDTVGKRLSERVASASIANEVDFTNGV